MCCVKSADKAWCNKSISSTLRMNYSSVVTKLSGYCTYTTVYIFMKWFMLGYSTVGAFDLYGCCGTRCRNSRMEKVRKQGRDDHIKQSSIQTLHIIFTVHVLWKKLPVGGCIYYMIISTLFLNFFCSAIPTSCYIFQSSSAF